MLKKYKHIIIGSLLVALGISLAAYAAGPIFRQFTSVAGTPHIQGQFKHDGTGNAGEVSFIQAGTLAGKDGYFLTGTFWIETIGIATFTPGTMLVAPTTRLDDPWTINGTIDSNAGKIYLTGVLYLPNENILVGSGWNNGVGYVPFGSGSLGIPGSVTNTGIAQGFVGKVKILGTIGGNNAFDTFYSVGTRYNASLMNDTLNRIKKAVQSGNAVCPYNEQACAYDYAIRFDLNYFRNYLSGGTLLTTRAYPDSTYDNYSVIIEHDQRISTNPPPGFETK